MSFTTAAATGSGFRKRVLYLGTDVLDECAIGRAVDEPDIDDPRLVADIDALHGALQEPETFAAESLLAVVRLAAPASLGDVADAGHEPPARPSPRSPRPPGRAVLRAVDPCRGGTHPPAVAGIPGAELHDRLLDRPAPLSARSSHRGRSSAPPRGGTPAQVAAGVGFHDQAHLTRHFKRYVGTTPARSAASNRVRACGADGRGPASVSRGTAAPGSSPRRPAGINESSVSSQSACCLLLEEAPREELPRGLVSHLERHLDPCGQDLERWRSPSSWIWSCSGTVSPCVTARDAACWGSPSRSGSARRSAPRPSSPRGKPHGAASRAARTPSSGTSSNAGSTG